MDNKKNIELFDKKYPLLFSAVELNIEEEHLHKMLIPSGKEFEISNEKVPYFKKYGFKVSTSYSDLYSAYNGIKSDRYIPVSLYFYYITPFLCNLNLMDAYVDKNIYSILFPDVKQPRTLVKRINGRFYDQSFNEISHKEAMETLLRREDFIIKPSMDTGGGKGVLKIKTSDFDLHRISAFINDNYEMNWIAQETIKSHPLMSVFNSTSTNTIRIYTYRPVNSTDYVILGAALRFGGKGKDVDNACSGGGFLRLNSDGTLSDRVYRYTDVTCYHQSDFGFKVSDCKFYQKAAQLSLELHRRLPYFDLIGWDFTIDEEGDPVLIEFNRTPDCELIQIVNGPMFGDYLDDLMEAIKSHHTQYVVVAERNFFPQKQGFNHYFDFKKL